MSSLAEQQAMYYRDPDTGHLMMPGTKRPDGTWRKPRRIKEGYVPQDEVPLYESKGKQWAKSRGGGGDYQQSLSAEILNMKIDTFDSKILQPAYHIPGLNPDTPPIKPQESKSKNAKKKKKSNNSTSSAVNNSLPPTTNTSTTNNCSNSNDTSSTATDPAKKLRNLRKKLRDIENLEKKLNNGEIEKPEPEQLEKVARKSHVEEEIAALEKKVNSS